MSLLTQHNVQVLEQALALVAAHQRVGSPAYAGPVGAHLRHIVEHYEALLAPPVQGVVDYDSRPRDALLERCPNTAAARIALLIERLQRIEQTGTETDTDTDTHLSVCVRIGSAGEWPVQVPSTLARELVFVSSHAVHHFAVLVPHCRAQGIAIDADFGKAPATLAHQLAHQQALAAAAPQPESTLENA